MKKNIIIILIVLAIILFVPIPKGSMNDGGSRDYFALTYRVVKWNRLLGSSGSTYHKTRIYWFPDNFKDIDELWDMENVK